MTRRRGAPGLSAQMRGRVKFAPWAMVAFISALEEGKGVHELLELVRHAREARRRLSTAELNSMLNKAIREHVPPLVQNKRFKLFFATQADVDRPLILFVNDPKLVHFSYRRYLERSIREAADFEGTAIKLVFRARSERMMRGRDRLRRDHRPRVHHGLPALGAHRWLHLVAA